MPLLAGTRTGAVITVVGFGLGFGITTLATPARSPTDTAPPPTPPSAGRRAAPVTIAKATAPLAAAILLHTAGGFTPLLTAVAISCALAAVGITTRATIPAPQPSTAHTWARMCDQLA